jgi:hypothetical protein
MQADQPVIRSWLGRFAVAAERTDQGVTGRAGLLPAIEAFHALGLAEACRCRIQATLQPSEVAALRSEVAPADPSASLRAGSCVGGAED